MPIKGCFYRIPIMKINLAKSAGFCFGVKRAIDIALKTASDSGRVYMLGDIVHNEDVVKEIRKAGIKRINRLGSGKNKVLLIRAHGISQANLKKAHKVGYKIIDATCPMVRQIHRIAKKMEKKCRKIIVIGDKKHDEVLGIVGQLREKALIIESLRCLPAGLIKKIKKACVIVQSTQDIEKVLKIVAVLKKNIPDLQFFNTICMPTRMKQEEIRRIPQVNDLMLIIGSKNSANTKRLYQISKRLNKRSYWINSPEDLARRWFKGIKSVGITAGASTPESSIKKVINYIKRITKK